MKKIRVAVVAGGMSSEREISIKTGRCVFEGLNQSEKYQVSFLEISKTGKWGWRVAPEKKSRKIWSGDFPEKKAFQNKADIFFIGLHGAFGEDGRIQALFDWLGVRYTGSGVTASAIGMDKYRCAELLASFGMHVPQTVALRTMDETSARKEIRRAGIALPCIVKPNDAGSSVGVTLIKKQAQLKKALKEAFHESHEVLVQQRVKGREFSCGVLGNSGQKKITVLPPVEIVAHGADFFDYQAKYLSKETEELCPAPLGRSEAKELMCLSELAHRAIGCDGVSRSDFILSDQDKKFYFLEINTLPGMTTASICPKEARAAGMTFEAFVAKIVELGLRKI
jgi:D-alanine-D-alanine ligase